MQNHKVSIIIPCLNEEALIEACLAGIPDETCFEIILVDGGSADKTLDLAEKVLSARKNNSYKCINSKQGRAVQMNRGAHASQVSAEILCFLHVDTLVPKTFLQDMMKFANQTERAWGFFDVCFSDSAFSFKVISWFMNKRSRLTQIATGDQLIFLKADVFHAIEGYKKVPLMEDVEFSKRLKRLSQAFKPVCAVEISSRRWRSHGLLKTILLMWKLRFAYFLGAPEEKLYKQYYGSKR